MGVFEQIGHSLVEVISFSFLFLLASVCIVFAVRFIFKVFFPKSKSRLPVMLLSPAIAGLLFLIAYPMLFELYLSFTNLNLSTIGDWARGGSLNFVGFKNFIDVFTKSPLQEDNLLIIALRTVSWTVINVSAHLVGGLLLALILNQHIRWKSIYRMLIIIPWAIPQVVAVLAWKGEFNTQFGFVNIVLSKLVAYLPFLTSLNIGPVDWFNNHPFAMACIVNIWLGIPFMAVIILGALKSISPSFYQAASIDGASSWQKFWHITLPLIKPVIAPAITMGTIWTFNNISVIYLLTSGVEGADILVSALYKSAFNYFRYSYSAAFAFIMFIVLMSFAVVWMKLSKATERIYG